LNTASSVGSERARKNFATILHGLARIGQATVAGEIGVSESTVSRLKDGDLERLAALLAACELKVVPQHFKCAKPEIIEAALVFALAGMQQISRDSGLVWEE
jgi:hypothetical protein